MKTRNSVVANALAANAKAAKNFTPTSELEVGDVVRFKDSVRSVPHDEVYKVVKVSGKDITIKGGRDNSTSTEFSDRLEIVGNAHIAMNKPYDIPMGTNPADKITVKMDEFVPVHGQREAKPYYTTFDKLSTHLETWGLKDKAAKIRSELKKGNEYKTVITVHLPIVFSA